MDLKQALVYLANQARDAAEVQTINAPGDSGRWAIVHRDGKVEWFDRLHGPRSHRAHSFDSFVRATIGIHEPGSQTWVFVPQGEEIVATARVNQPEKHRDCVVMPVEITDEYNLLNQNPSPFDQKGLLRMLRVQLHRCGVDELVSLLTHVTFSSRDDGDSAITTGRSSLSRKTVNELQSKGEGPERKDLPETVTLNCHFLEETIRVMPNAPTVECLLDVDVASEKPFSLVPLAGEMSRMAGDAQDWIVAHLTQAFEGNEGIAVFAGGSLSTMRHG